MLKRVLIAVGIFALLNIYAASHVIRLWPLARQHEIFAWLAALGFFALQMAGPFGDHLWFSKFRKKGLGAAASIIDWASYIAFGAMSLLVVYGMFTDILGIVWALADPSSSPVALDHLLLLTLGGLTLGTIVLGVGQARRGPEVVDVAMPFPNLPPAFDGFRIVQISDLHVGPTIGRAYVENVVALANSLKPDLIALTGDFADGNVEDFGDIMMLLAGLKAPAGMFFITGNHEYFWDLHGWIEQFKKLGAQPLFNEHRLITRGGDAIVLAGVPDISTAGMGVTPSFDPVKAAQGAPPGLVKILLAHQPASYRKAHEAGFDLQISGHTHGGQYFPFNLLIRFFQRYYKGLNRHENMWVYVSRGTGYWGPPLRAGVPSEVTLLTLKRA